MKTQIILLLIACNLQGMAQEAKRNNTNYQNPEYAPMGALYAAYFDAYLYIGF